MNAVRVSVADVTVEPKTFFDRVRERLGQGARLVGLHASRAEAPSRVAVTAIFGLAAGLEVLRTEIEAEAGFHTLTREFPCAHVFEREIHERWGVEPRGHPWLKPVRFSGANRGRAAEYPFYRVDGKEVHEVGVGPIHAGVIEPGHFRFMCLGEQVHHLEIQLGYQHRDVESLLLARPLLSLGPLVETIAGDTSVGHAWAYAAAVEALYDREPTSSVSLTRGIGLELERVAMHLATLSGLFADIALLQGASTYGRLRTTAINTSMLVCGSRFGRGFVRPGPARARLDGPIVAVVRENLALLRRDLAPVNDLVRTSRTVAHRLVGVGVVGSDDARRLGVVGVAARASGVEVDTRLDPARRAPYAEAAPVLVVEKTGDCWARALVRIREIDASLDWLERAVERIEPGAAETPALADVPPGRTLSVAVVEGFRGEIVHAIETDALGRVADYRVQDPSLRNWFALALAVRENEISDFPICNKSFDLSYCGNDL